MYSIRWDNGKLVVVGTKESITSLANLFEAQKTPFKVADVAGFGLMPYSFGYGKYEFWLSPEDSF
jgi:hypothetical protein